MEFDPAEVLFVGLASERVCWYRCALPAMFMGADWAGVAGQPPQLGMATGYVKGGTNFPRFEDYKILVIQQPRGRGWFNFIKKQQARGAKVLFEIDDYIHGIRNTPDHDYRQHFEKPMLKEVELCMRACDGMICSTEYIARRYSSFNSNVHVCLNGLDLGRYKVTRPPRGEVNGKTAVMIGWAGATGHTRGALPWLNAVLKVMEEHENTCFVTIGQPWATRFTDRFGTRAISIPFALIEQYPAAMCLFDIGLAPAGKTNWHRGKSQLRFYEGGAIGLPMIVDPELYTEVRHGENGLCADDQGEVHDSLVQLIEDPELRWNLGASAMKYVYENRDMRVAVGAWKTALETVSEE